VTYARANKWTKRTTGIHETRHLMIAALSKEDRKSVRSRIQGALFTLQQCEVYLRDYGAGNQMRPSYWA